MSSSEDSQFSKKSIHCVHEEYLELRQQSGDLTRQRPRIKHCSSTLKNWSSFLENVMTEGESAVHSLLQQDICDDDTSVSSAISIMQNKLLNIGTDMIDIAKKCAGSGYDCVLILRVTEFWMEVNKFLNLLFSWAELAIVKILRQSWDKEKKGRALQDVFDQILDLLWGIYA